MVVAGIFYHCCGGTIIKTSTWGKLERVIAVTKSSDKCRALDFGEAEGKWNYKNQRIKQLLLAATDAL